MKAEAYLQYINEQITHLEEKIGLMKKDISDTNKLRSKYDLKIRTYKGGGIRNFYSPDVNSLANKVEFEECYSDYDLYACIYLEDGEYRIYTDPYRFCIGRKTHCCSSHITENFGWKEEMRKVGVNNQVIEQIVEYFEQQE